MNMTQENVLLVGGAGFIGSRVAAILRRRGHGVCVLDNFFQAHHPEEANYGRLTALRMRQMGEGVRIVRGDATDPIAVSRAFDELPPQRVLHLAAVTRAPLNDVLAGTAAHVSVASVVTIMNEAARRRAARVVYTSSSYVYGDFERSPCDETHPRRPRSVYGAAKLSGEAFSVALGLQLGVPVTVVRPIAVYGPGDLNGKLSMQNLRRAVEDGIIPLHNVPGETTDFTYVDDVARGLIAALFAERAAGEAFNVAAGRGHTVEELLAVFAKLGHCVTAAAELSARGRPTRGSLSIAKARELLEYSPEVDLERGLAECLGFLAEHRDILNHARPNATT
jgi:nucleoside-diphosphate-sugar epimerase